MRYAIFHVRNMHWYLVYTHCWHEKKVKERLERERFETFLPLIEQWSRRRDRQKRIHIPLFPGYLFVRTEMNVNTYLKILKIKGVIGFFCNAGKPAIIPDEEVDSIQISLKNGKDAKLCPNLHAHKGTTKDENKTDHPLPPQRAGPYPRLTQGDQGPDCRG